MEKTDFCSLKLAKMLFFPSLGNLLTTSSRRERFSIDNSDINVCLWAGKTRRCLATQTARKPNRFEGQQVVTVMLTLFICYWLSSFVIDSLHLLLTLFICYTVTTKFQLSGFMQSRVIVFLVYAKFTEFKMAAKTKEAVQLFNHSANVHKIKVCHKHVFKVPSG